MKTEKIVSITVANAFILMLFGSFLSGCQKSLISKTGLYSTLKTNNRIPASANTNQFTKYQDPKQIYIYCQLNEINPKKCFEHFVERKVSDLKKKNLKISSGDIPSFAQTQSEVESINQMIIQNSFPKIKKLTDHRQVFCEKNSKYYLDRCLNQYVSKEAVELVNVFQNNNSPLNGHEYLYLQKQFELKIQSELEIAKNNIISKKKKAL